MPTIESVLGFSNRWYPTAIETAERHDVAGRSVRIVTPALFIATKLEAFHGRGGGDIMARRDQQLASLAMELRRVEALAAALHGGQRLRDDIERRLRLAGLRERRRQQAQEVRPEVFRARACRLFCRVVRSV